MLSLPLFLPTPAPLPSRTLPPQDASKKKAAQTLAALDALTQLGVDLSTLGSQGLMPNSNGGENREQRLKREREADAGDGEDVARDRSAVRMRESGRREEAREWEKGGGKGVVRSE